MSIPYRAGSNYQNLTSKQSLCSQFGRDLESCKYIPSGPFRDSFCSQAGRDLKSCDAPGETFRRPKTSYSHDVQNLIRIGYTIDQINSMTPDQMYQILDNVGLASGPPPGFGGDAMSISTINSSNYDYNLGNTTNPSLLPDMIQSDILAIQNDYANNLPQLTPDVLQLIQDYASLNGNFQERFIPTGNGFRPTFQNLPPNVVDIITSYAGPPPRNNRGLEGPILDYQQAAIDLLNRVNGYNP